MKEQGSTRGDRWSILSEKYLTRVLMFIGWFGVNAGMSSSSGNTYMVASHQGIVFSHCLSFLLRTGENGVPECIAGYIQGTYPPPHTFLAEGPVEG